MTAPEGIKLDAGKPRTDLLPFDALLDVSEVLAYGEKKYAARNWELGMAWGRLVAAALRHLWAWCGGQDKDAESGLHHLAHFACCALMLLALVKRKVGTDDRFVERFAGVIGNPAAPGVENGVRCLSSDLVGGRCELEAGHRSTHQAHGRHWE